MKSLKKINYWQKKVAFTSPRSARAYLRPVKKIAKGYNCDCSGDSCSASCTVSGDGSGDGCNSNCR